MKYIKTFENIDIDEMGYIGKYVLFYRGKNLYFGKVEGIIERTPKLQHIDFYFIIISNLHPQIPALKKPLTIKFYLENIGIVKVVDTKEEAIEFYDVIKNVNNFNI